MAIWSFNHNHRRSFSVLDFGRCAAETCLLYVIHDYFTCYRYPIECALKIVMKIEIFIHSVFKCSFRKLFQVQLPYHPLEHSHVLKLLLNKHDLVIEKLRKNIKRTIVIIKTKYVRIFLKK